MASSPGTGQMKMLTLRLGYVEPVTPPRWRTLLVALIERRRHLRRHGCSSRSSAYELPDAAEAAEPHNGHETSAGVPGRAGLGWRRTR